LAAAAVCLVAGLGVAIRFVVTAAGDPTTSGGEYVLGAIMGLILYGPALLWAAWPIAFPAIAAIGVGAAFFRRRYRPGGENLAVLRIARVLLFGYAAVLVVMWFVWLLGAR
jgi:hypothetical protein